MPGDQGEGSPATAGKDALMGRGWGLRAQLSGKCRESSRPPERTLWGQRDLGSRNSHYCGDCLNVQPP